MDSTILKTFSGRRCKLFISVDEKTFVYTADTIIVDDQYISFVDRFGRAYSYPVADVRQCEELQ